MSNRQSENINNPSLLYLAVTIERGLFFKIMRISELPQDVKEKALEYQRNYNTSLGNKKTDTLESAFDWGETKEGYKYWVDWCTKTNIEEDKPKQYQIGIDTFTRAESNLSKEEIIAICKFNIDKYNWRKKNQDKEDFKKIIDYANWAIKNL